MAYKMLVGLNVKNDQMYSDYRKAMIPLLKTYGGGFDCDFKLSEVLIPENNQDLNRLFIIYAENKESMDSFFSDPKYKEIQEKYFNDSVARKTLFANFESRK